jgi:hypothetical protein
MGDRASVSFRTGKEQSITLFSQGGGQNFFAQAADFAEQIVQESIEKGNFSPLYRLEPQTVMVEFVHHLTKNMGYERVESNYYFGVDMNDGDNSGNGHMVVDLEFFRSHYLKTMNKEEPATKPEPLPDIFKK